MGSPNLNRQIVVDIDANTTPTLLEVLKLAKDYAPHLGTIGALQKYYNDHIAMCKKTTSPELWYRLKMVSQLISVVGFIQNDFYQNLCIMN